MAGGASVSVERVNVHLHTAARPVSPALRVRIAAKSIKAVQSQAFKRGSMNNRCETECQAYYVKLVDTKDDLLGPLCKDDEPGRPLFLLFLLFSLRSICLHDCGKGYRMSSCIM